LQDDFIKIYGESVNEALFVLGPHIARIINFYVNEKYSIRLADTWDNPKNLTHALETTIDGATRVIQRRILRILYEKMGIEPAFVISSNFEERIIEAKKKFEEKDRLTGKS
jgi:hypothetical protein